MIRIAAGAPETFAAGRVYPIKLPRDHHGRPREALILRAGDGALRAYLNRCQHLPIPLDSGARRFLTPEGAHLQCLTHGARYRIDDGFCDFGPCEGSVLEALALEFDAELVYIVLPS